MVGYTQLTPLTRRLRYDYTLDCEKCVERWNKIIEKTGVKFCLELPHTAFHRQIGEFRDVNATPKGIIVDAAEWAKRPTAGPNDSAARPTARAACGTFNIRPAT